MLSDGLCFTPKRKGEYMSSKDLRAFVLVTSLLTAPLCAKEEAIATNNLDSEIIDTEEECVESLMDSRPDIFCRSHIIVLDTVSDPDGTHVKLFNPDLAEIWTYKLKKNKDQKKRGVWNDLKVLRSTKRIYSANLKFDNKYEGYRTSMIGAFFEKLLGLTESYKGTLFLDEYKHYPLWNVILKDREELSDFFDYLLANLAKRGKRSFDRKPVLLLILKDDPYFESLTAEDVGKMKSLFQVVDYKDTKTTEFFTKTQLTMDDLVMRFESGNPIYLGENTRKALFRRFEKYFKDFNLQDIAPWIIGGAIATFATWYFEKIILDGWKDKISPRITPSWLLPKPKQNTA